MGNTMLSERGKAVSQFIWTTSAVSKWQRGVSDPRHTISAPNITEVYDGFVRQLRAGTPWILVTDGRIVAQGAA
jgi:hypothetical protein